MTALLVSSLMLLSDTTVFGPTWEDAVIEAQHTGEESNYGNIDSYFRNEFLRRWPQRNLYHFVGISRYWRGQLTPIEQVAAECKKLMCED